jgi:hypothetical protein
LERRSHKSRHSHESAFGGAYGSLFGGWNCTPSREQAIKAYWRSVNATPKKSYPHYDVVAEPRSPGVVAAEAFARRKRVEAMLEKARAELGQSHSTVSD